MDDSRIICGRREVLVSPLKMRVARVGANPAFKRFSLLEDGEFALGGGEIEYHELRPR